MSNKVVDHHFARHLALASRGIYTAVICSACSLSWSRNCWDYELGKETIPLLARDFTGLLAGCSRVPDSELVDCKQQSVLCDSCREL